MKYNAANHTIETDDGRLVARLTDEVSGPEGFQVADGWGGTSEREKDLEEELSGLKVSACEWESEARDLESRAERLDRDLRDCRERLSRAESERDDLRSSLEGVEIGRDEEM